MEPKYLPLDDRLYHYACSHRSDVADPILADLRAETERFGEDAKCQISPEQGTFMQLLVSAIGTHRAIEVGTFTGYSSICIARGLAPGGRLICIDQSKEWTDVARKYWAKAGLADRIELRLGSAVKSLQQLSPELVFDFAFIDAAKTEYDTYYELILPHVRPNGLLLFDNMLWHGQLRAGEVSSHPSAQAVDALNRKLAHDRRIECVLLTIADGIQLCRKK